MSRTANAGDDCTQDTARKESPSAMDNIRS
jgi:hypothetical protein